MARWIPSYKFNNAVYVLVWTLTSKQYEIIELSALI